MIESPSARLLHASSQSDAALRHLLLSFPDLDASASGAEALNRLIEGAAHHLLAPRHPGAILTVGEVVDAIRSMTGLTYEATEVIAALVRLEKAGYIAFRHDEKRAFVVNERRYRELCSDAGYRADRLAAVRKEWTDDLLLRHDLNATQIAALWASLERFIAVLMNTYAAEAAAFLYQTAGAHERFSEVVGQRAPQIAEVAPEGLYEVARVEFPRFVETPSAARTEYLVHCLRGAFVFHMLSLDPAASELVRENVSEKTLYLDTNVVFRLLGFDGPTLAYGPLAVVEMSKALRCRLLVAEETVHEFLRRLRTEVRTLRQNPISKETSQRLIAEHRGDEFSFMRAYYRQFLDGRVRTVEQFERKYSNVSQLLRGYGIEIDENAEIDEDDEKSDAFLDTRSAFNMWTSDSRHPDAVAHDAFILMMMRELRGRRDKRASEAKAWFLTYDRALTSYSVHKAGSDHLPVVMLADDWLQIARPFLPRTDEYDQSFIAMLRFPVAFDDPSVVKLNEMVEALQRLDTMKDLPAPVIAGMVSDGAMLTRIRLAQDEKAVQRLVEVESATYAKEQEAQVERLSQTNRVLGERVGQLEHVNSELRHQSDIVTGTATAVTQQRDEVAAKLDQLQQSVPTQLELARQDAERASEARFEQRLRDTEARLRAEAWTLVRRVVCGAAAVVLLVAVGMLLWLRPASRDPLALAFLTLGLALAWYALYEYGRRGRTGGLISTLADVAGVAGVIVLVLQAMGMLPTDMRSRDPQPGSEPSSASTPATPATPASPPPADTSPAPIPARTAAGEQPPVGQ